MCIILKTADRRAKRTKIWYSGYYSTHRQGTFDARLVEFGLGSFGALCKISSFTIFLLLSQFSSDPSKDHTRYHNHTGCHVFGDLPKNCNKRPRGLDHLLGHLLVKIIPVTYQLSGTKIPNYLSQKQIQGHQKLEMHRMTPNLP